MSRSTVSAFFSILSGKITILALNIILTPLLVRFLGSAEYGQYAVVLSIFGIASYFMTSGTNEGIRKFISEREDKVWKDSVFGLFARIAIGLAFIVASIFLLIEVSGIVKDVFGEEYVSLFYLLALLAVGKQATQFLIWTLMGLQLENNSEPIRVLNKTLFVVLALITAYYGYGVEGVLISHILSRAVIFIILVYVVKNYVDFHSVVSKKYCSLPNTTIYKYTTSTIIFFTLLMSLLQIDIVILQQYEPEQTVGYYKGALVLAETLWIAPLALQLVLVQRVSYLWKEDNLEKIQSQATTATRFSLSFTGLLVIGMAALADPFVPLYLGDDFRPAIVPLLILLPGVIGFAAARPLISITQARRSLRPLIIATGCVAIVNVLLNLTLIPYFGMIGAATATSIAYGCLFFSQLLTAQSLGYSPLADVRPIKLSLTLLFTSVFVFGSTIFFSTIAQLIFTPIIGLLVFLLSALLTGLIKINEINEIVSKI